MRERLSACPSPAISEYNDLSIQSFNSVDNRWNEYVKAWEQDSRSKLNDSLQAIISMRKRWLATGCGVELPGSLLSEMLHHSKWANEKCDQFTERPRLMEEILQKFYSSNRIGNDYKTSKSKRMMWKMKRNYSLGTALSRGSSKDQSSKDLSSKDLSSEDASVDSKGAFDGISFALIGSSGSGKTSLMAKLAATVYGRENSPDNVDDFGERMPARPVIIRFCGTSAGSASGLSLVVGIIAQIQHALGVQSVDSPQQARSKEGAQATDTEQDELTLLQHIDYDAAVNILHKLLQDHAVILLIDSIDQLSDDYLESSRISFLDGVRPHPRTRIVISALPDERDALTGGWLYCYQCHTRCKESKVPIVDVVAFQASIIVEDSEFKDILQRILAKKQRCLTAPQWEVVMAAAAAEPTALYANLVARIVEQWNSYDENCVLQPTVKGLLNQTFDDLERKFGAVMTRTALGLITFSASGLTDNELEDLLSMDDNVLNSVFQYAKSTVRRLPSHVWLRLRGAMAGLLVERTAGCLGWYHRQLQETAVSRYSSEERRRLHSLMGTYFSNIVPDAMRESRNIAPQPLTLTPTNVFFASTEAAESVVVNNRRITESLHHLVNAEMFSELSDQIRDAEIVFAVITWGNPFSLISSLAKVDTKINEWMQSNDGCMLQVSTLKMQELHKCVDHYLRWFRLDMTAIIAAPERALFSSVTGNQPVTSIARQDMLRYLSHRWGSKMKASLQFTASAWIRSRVIAERTISSFGRKRFGALTSVLRGHNASVYGISWSKHRNVIASGSGDKSILLWDVHTGHVTGKIIGRSDFVRAVAFSPDGLSVASASKDSSVRVWDSVTGSQLLLLSGHTDNVWCLCWSPCGKFIVSGSSDSTVRVWYVGAKDTATADEQRCLHVLRVHPRTVMCVRWNPLGNFIATASMDSSASVLKVVTESETRVDVYVATALPKFAWGVFVCEWSTAGTTLAAAGVDGVIRFYNQKYTDDSSPEEVAWQWGQFKEVKNGNTDHVSAMAFSRTDALIMAGSYNGNLYIWDLESENLVFFAAVYGIVYGALFSPHDENSFAVCSQSGNISLYHVDHINSEVPPSSRFLFPASSLPMTPVASPKKSSSALARAIDYVDSALANDHVDDADEEIVEQLKGIDSSVIAVSYASTGSKLASASTKGEIIVWDLVNGTKHCRMHIHAKNTRIEWSLNGDRLATCCDLSHVSVWDGTTGKEVIKLIGHSDRVTACYWIHNDEWILTGSYDKTFKIWSVETGVVINEYLYSGRVRFMAAHMEATSVSIACVDDYTTKAIQLMTVDLEHISHNGETGAVFGPGNWLLGGCLEGQPMISTRIVFNNAGTRLASSCVNEKIYVWDEDTSAPTVLVGHGHVIWALCWSTDDRRIVSGDKLGLLCSWDIKAGTLLSKFQNGDTCVCSCNFNPTAGLIAAGLMDGSILIMNSELFFPVTSYYVGRVFVRTVDMSLCGKWIVGGYSDGVIRVFDVSHFDLCCELRGHAADVTKVAFTSNGRYLLSSSFDGTVCCWTFAWNEGTSIDGVSSTPTITLRETISRSQPVRCLAWSPCYRFFALGGHSKSLEIVDIDSLSVVATADAPGWIVSLAWSAESSQIAIACLSNDVLIYDFPVKEAGICSAIEFSASKCLYGHCEIVSVVGWNHRSNQILSCSLDHTVRIWDPETGSTSLTLDCSNACARTAQWCNDGSNRIITGDADNCLRIWDGHTGVCTAELSDHTDSILAVNIWSSVGLVEAGYMPPEDSPDVNSTLILSCSADGTIRIWDSIGI
jgi:WD40 repeat protein